MNSGMRSDKLFDEYYAENIPTYRINCSSRLATNSTNKYLRYSHIPLTQKNSDLQKKQYSHSINQHSKYLYNPQQHSNLSTNNRLYGKSSSTAYYDSIRARVYLNTSMHIQSKSSTRSQLPNYESKLLSNQASMKYHDDPSLEYPKYTIDLLIERLIPTDTYKPKETFLYSMIMCSRLHIRPSLLLNKIAYLTIISLRKLTYDRSVRILQNFLDILLQWTETFPYDFRNIEMMSQLEELQRKISVYEPTFPSIINRIDKQLRSKLEILDDYEEYIRQLNIRSSKSLTLTALSTDIIYECSTSILFAQQVTHIELDRLKLIGPEELVQYFIMKSASEEERAHPNRTIDSETTTSNQSKSSHHVHDTKLTYTFETYIQWFNRLTFFVATEIIKHTQKRLRIQLINYFIDAAYHCLQIYNFNSMFAIIGGLSMQPVKRLRKTWEKISMEKFNQLEQFKNVSKNFANYRNALKTAMNEAENHRWQLDHIVIPFTSLVSQDVYFIKTRSKDYTTEGGINLQKYYAITKCIFEEFIECKQSNCSFQRNDKIINYIITSPTFNEDSLMLASFECEPATTPHETKILTKLQEEHENRAR